MDMQTETLSNQPVNAREKVEKTIKALGADAALGKDSLPKLAIAVVEAAQTGVFTLEKDRAGDDDAKKAYTIYVESETRKSIHDRSSNGLKANVSKVRALIKCGIEADKHDVDAVGVIEQTSRVHREMVETDIKTKPLFAAMVEVARLQQGKSEALTDQEIRACCAKPDPAEKTVESELAAILKRTDNLITGEGGVKYTPADDDSAGDDPLYAARALIKGLHDVLALTTARDAKRTECEELGMDVTDEQLDLLIAMDKREKGRKH